MQSIETDMSTNAQNSVKGKRWIKRNDALRQLKSELEGKVSIEHWNFNG